jgi:hypothetical protein
MGETSEGQRVGRMNRIIPQTMSSSQDQPSLKTKITKRTQFPSLPETYQSTPCDKSVPNRRQKRTQIVCSRRQFPSAYLLARRNACHPTKAIWSAATCRRFATGRHVCQSQSAVVPARSKTLQLSTPCLSTSSGQVPTYADPCAEGGYPSIREPISLDFRNKTAIIQHGASPNPLCQLDHTIRII